MINTHYRIEKITPTIGAEVLGVDLSRPSDGLISEIRRQLLENKVIFFRDQELTIEQHKAFALKFGDLYTHFAVAPKFPEHPEVIVFETTKDSKIIAGDVWHTDGSASAEPPMGSILYMREMPSSGGGDTLFGDMYAAYDALSEPVKVLLEGLSAIHDGQHTLRGRYDVDMEVTKFPISEHPVVRTHPETRRKCLYVNKSYTSRIVQLSQQESKYFLAMLFEHIEQSRFHCRFKWQNGSVAFWDNRCVIHHAIWDYYPERRCAHRLTIKGDRPF